MICHAEKMAGDKQIVGVEYIIEYMIVKVVFPFTLVPFWFDG